LHSDSRVFIGDMNSINTRWFKYDRDICGLFTQKSVPVIFEPPCIIIPTYVYVLTVFGVVRVVRT